jgi:hypothetical protein
MVAMIMVADMVALHVAGLGLPAFLNLRLPTFPAVRGIVIFCVIPVMVERTAALHNIEATRL